MLLLIMIVPLMIGTRSAYRVRHYMGQAADTREMVNRWPVLLEGTPTGAPGMSRTLAARHRAERPVGEHYLVHADVRWAVEDAGGRALAMAGDERLRARPGLEARPVLPDGVADVLARLIAAQQG